MGTATNDQEVSEEPPKKKTSVDFTADTVLKKIKAQVVKPAAAKLTHRYGNCGRKYRTSSPVRKSGGVDWDDIPSALSSSSLAAVLRNLKSRAKVDQTVPLREPVELSGSQQSLNVCFHMMQVMTDGYNFVFDRLKARNRSKPVTRPLARQKLARHLGNLKSSRLKQKTTPMRKPGTWKKFPTTKQV
jgi:LysM repeat protein